LQTPAVQQHLQHNCMKKRTCFGRYFVKIKVLTYDILVVKFLSLALKHYVIYNGIILVSDINSKTQFKENFKLDVEYIVILAIESFAICAQFV
jgi:hypothetical protein